MEYAIKRRIIDSNNQTNWDSIPVANINNVCWNFDNPDIKSYGQLCYDEEHLYVRLSAVEKDIRAKEKGFYGMPCRDSCLEFFFCPVADGRYFNIEFNPNCAMFLGFGTGPDALYRLQAGAEPEPIFCPISEINNDNWNISYSIPFSFIRAFFPDFHAESGTKMTGNLYKCGDKCIKKHLFSWNPMPEWHSTFHYPKAFGIFRFE